MNKDMIDLIEVLAKKEILTNVKCSIVCLKNDLKAKDVEEETIIEFIEKMTRDIIVLK